MHFPYILRFLRLAVHDIMQSQCTGFPVSQTPPSQLRWSNEQAFRWLSSLYSRWILLRDESPWKRRSGIERRMLWWRNKERRSCSPSKTPALKKVSLFFSMRSSSKDSIVENVSLAIMTMWLFESSRISSFLNPLNMRGKRAGMML